MECAVAALGAAVILSTFMATPAWIDRHVLPDFSRSHAGFVVREVIARSAIVLTGLALIGIAPRVQHLRSKEVRRKLFAASVRMALAVMLALSTSEVLLRIAFRPIFDETCCGREPLRRPDPILGWAHVAARTGRVEVAGRTIEYVTSAAGDRVARAGEETNPAAPTILFAGESFMYGYKLPWEESVPAQVAALSGVQGANLAVEGYSVTQAYLRLAAELPRFRDPAAVVFLFLPSVFKKDLDDARPHVDSELRPLPVEHPWRLAVVARWLVPYESTARVDNGVVVVRGVLRAAMDLARSRGAVPLVIVPRVLPEEAGARALRQRVLDDGGLPYVLVDLAPEWHVPHDGHPDARGNRAMAEAIWRALEKNGTIVSSVPP